MTVLRAYVDTYVQRERVGWPSFADKAVPDEAPLQTAIMRLVYQ